MRLYAKMSDNTKQVRVDNWGIFFLQRLQMFFSKTDYCDMTLQFEGNVQLKVHRLVMNACTEYFQFLEETCTLEENVIMMPSDLQADVIVPIVNFMYTGMLEFHLSIFDRLYQTAQIMNITILTKLLDAQKQTPVKAALKKRQLDSPNTQVKKPAVKSPHDLPAPLPGRKLPVWKRKSIPAPAQPHTHSVSPLCYPEPKWSQASDPLSIPDNTPKPTRFEWPDDDLPSLNLMDTTFEDISYTSKPLMTKAEEHRAGPSFDDLKHIPNASRAETAAKQGSSTDLDMEEMKNYVKEQKIRSGLSHNDEEEVDAGQKRKAADPKNKIAKKVRFDEQDSKTTTISIAADVKNPDLDHQKIVTEILKKYPQLVKKNKNIRLKIMAKNKKETVKKAENKSPWMCERCSSGDDKMEFALYYLYRKHMTDVHSEKFDPKLCKYCGHKCNKRNLLMFHLYTKHGMRPPPGYSFPKCDQCPYIALSAEVLESHKERHGKNEIQCVECKLAFTSQTTLTSHVQITGHTGKSMKNNFDCQYCTKRYHSGVNLFSHVRLQHRNEALRDGIVSVDEVDDLEADNDDSKDEYILPEIMSEPQKKVNILSNVKVQEQTQQLALEPSSEAEALNNVATGIATSLGLVDIVVLNDNQQLFLQEQSEQPEFILPELTAQSRNDVISEGVIAQSMLPSTDELVMVLTDHDYGDNQEDANNDNSNIVVLYSHPVDGQQNQFVVNPQTALFEIRNGSTGDQVVMNQETHIESIEMIQREIESHGGEMKAESLYEDVKPEVGAKPVENSQAKETQQSQSDLLIDSLSQGEQLEFTTPLTEETQEEKEEETVEDVEKAPENQDTETQSLEDQEQVVEKETGGEPEKNEEPPEIITEEEQNVSVEDKVQEDDKNEEQVEENSKEESQVVNDEEIVEKESQSVSEEQNQESKESSKEQIEEKSEEPIEVSSEERVQENSEERVQESSEERVQESEEPVDISEEGMDVTKEEEEEEEDKTQQESDTSTSQFNDDNSQESQQKEESSATKISILDDWEDTDSQQSDHKEKEKVAGETVHKLMDDWGEEEEDEDDRKDADG